MAYSLLWKEALRKKPHDKLEKCYKNGGRMSRKILKAGVRD
jgi:hypothetical protein